MQDKKRGEGVFYGLFALQQPGAECVPPEFLKDFNIKDITKPSF